MVDDGAVALTPAAHKILDAASHLFYERGLHAVGVDTIAAAAGVTKKTLYDRFGSKDALVVSYLRRRDDRWRGELTAALDRSTAVDAERVLVLFDAAAAWSAAHGGRGCSAINARAEVDDPAHPVAVEVSRQKAWLYDLVTRLCRDAGLERPGQLARSLLLLYDGALATTGVGTFSRPFASARAAARVLCAAHRHDARLP